MRWQSSNWVTQKRDNKVFLFRSKSSFQNWFWSLSTTDFHASEICKENLTWKYHYHFWIYWTLRRKWFFSTLPVLLDHGIGVIHKNDLLCFAFSLSKIWIHLEVLAVFKVTENFQKSKNKNYRHLWETIKKSFLESSKRKTRVSCKIDSSKIYNFPIWLI
jgi:hypothetical protein